MYMFIKDISFALSATKIETLKNVNPFAVAWLIRIMQGVES